MITLASHIQEELARNPLLQEALSEGIANLSSVARTLKPSLEEKRMMPASESAIIMSLRRLQKSSGKEITAATHYLREVHSISITPGLCEIVVRDSDILTPTTKALAIACENPHLFLNVARGVRDAVVVMSSELKTDITKEIEPSKILFEADSLTAITLTMSLDSIEPAGIYHLLFRALAWRGIPLMEVISVAAEVTFVVRDEYANEALQVLRQVTSR